MKTSCTMVGNQPEKKVNNAMVLLKSRPSDKAKAEQKVYRSASWRKAKVDCALRKLWYKQTSKLTRRQEALQQCIPPVVINLRN